MPRRDRRRPSTRPPRAAAAGLLALVLAGCTVGPDYDLPSLPLPERWAAEPKAAAPQAPRLARWWTRFDDPVLDRLVEEAVAGNPDAAAASARIREARAAYRQAFGALLPTLDGAGSVTRIKNASPSGIEVPPYTQWRAGLDAGWEIDLFGGNRRAAEAAGYGVEAAEDDHAATLLTLVGDVAANYVELRGYQARIALARRTAASQRETAALTRTKFESGAVSAVDLANAEGQAATTEARVPQLEAAQAETVHRLGVLTGRPPAAFADRLAKPAPIPAPRLPVATGVPADLLRNRPDLRLAERRLAQSTARIGVATAALYPSVSLSGVVTTTALKFGDLGRSSTIAWSFGPAVSIPIFAGGRLQAGVEVAEAQRDASFAAWHAAVLGALEDVENAAVALGAERARAGRLSAAAASYRKAVTLGRTLYQSGSSSFLDVLDAERSLYAAEDSLIASRVAVATNWIALNKALGGGWDGATGTAAAAPAGTALTVPDPAPAGAPKS